MYPRLKLARNLLNDDGVIFISIDDHEVSNLRKICDEIFGEENFINNIIWQKKYSPQNDAKWLSDNHDHIILYAKSKTIWRPILLPRTEAMNDRYINPDNDPKGPWKLITLHAKSGNSINFSYKFKNGVSWSPPSGTFARFSKETLEKYDDELKIYFGKDGKSIPSVKNYLSEVKQGVTPLTIWTHSEAGHNHSAKEDIKQVFSGENPFDTPKPVKLLLRILNISATTDSIVLDFFAGSGTTAHAVMQLNAEDGGSRKCISVQLPEPTEENSEAFKSGYTTISEITKERIRRAGDMILKDQEARLVEVKEKLKSIAAQIEKAGGMFADDPKVTALQEQQQELTDQITELEHSVATLDIGFKAFRLDSSNIRTWDGNPDSLDANLFTAASNIKEDRTEEDILYEILLKYGLDLAIPQDQKEIAGKTVYNIGMGALFICLADGVTTTVAEGIGQWKRELAPATCKVIFKDTGFTDVEKTNTVQILKRYGIEEVSSV
jgi:adenine-specific DNA-methyltransferase